MLIFMRSYSPLPHIMRLAICLLLAALLTACGFKGPLYLPKPEAQPVKPAPQQTPPKAGMPEPVSQ